MDRFSRDMADVDTVLLERWESLLMCSLRVISILVMVTISSSIFAAVLVPIAGFYMYFREHYRRTARELQRLESMSRSPVVIA